eukprot:TRINITY_DN1713_c0_g1_i2.p1 TRINITY_DN1713_c0_g1~~TRINITY_DN1713_c0_g1_i2.p1  ORF type:complete len:306 (+),score=91.34 TRINITY_DN1713_c0_g1_i2:581-1498(+)
MQHLKESELLGQTKATPKPPAEYGEPAQAAKRTPVRKEESQSNHGGSDDEREAEVREDAADGRKAYENHRTEDFKGEATPGYLTGKVEAPKGKKDMGGWVSRVYTEEQQKRMKVDQYGEPAKADEHTPVRKEESQSNHGGFVHAHARDTAEDLHEAKEDSAAGHVDVRKSQQDTGPEKAPADENLKGEATPGYLTGKVEAPKGKKDMGGWVSRVYTEEQQKRMKVDQYGEPAKKPRKPTYMNRIREQLKKSKMQPVVLAAGLVVLTLICLAYCCLAKCCEQEEPLEATYEFVLESEVAKNPGNQL